MVSLRYEFVRLAEREGANIRELCRRFTISPPTAYKWLGRYAQEGEAGLADRPRRPRGSPRRTAAAFEQAVLGIREEHPAWGGRTIRKVLLDRDGSPVPSPSTITAILRRHGRIAPAERAQRDWQRFEHPRPNDLWQMDFKGHFPTGAGRCHPLTIVDDHSRFAIGLQACADERTRTVQERLRAIFRVYGLPERLLMDNGSPWGSDAAHPRTPLTVWLLRLGIRVSHGRPYHPQTQGKGERFHRTLKAEVLQGRHFADLPACQEAFDHFRHSYNNERPHEALGQRPPIRLYTPSFRPYPSRLSSPEYGAEVTVRRVRHNGEIKRKGDRVYVSESLRGEPIGLVQQDERTWSIQFGPLLIGVLDDHARRIDKTPVHVLPMSPV